MSYIKPFISTFCPIFQVFINFYSISEYNFDHKSDRKIRPSIHAINFVMSSHLPYFERTLQYVFERPFAKLKKIMHYLFAFLCFFQSTMSLDLTSELLETKREVENLRLLVSQIKIQREELHQFSNDHVILHWLKNSILDLRKEVNQMENSVQNQSEQLENLKKLQVEMEHWKQTKKVRTHFSLFSSFSFPQQIAFYLETTLVI